MKHKLPMGSHDMEGCRNRHLQPPPSLAWEGMSLQMPCVSSDIQTEDQVRGAKTSCPYSPLFQFLSHRNFHQEKKSLSYATNLRNTLF